jgi:hypothetical protein
MSLAVPLTDPKFCAMAAGKLRVTITPAKASIVKILFIVASRHKPYDAIFTFRALTTLSAIEN